jgi:ATP-binding cassette subfamily C exporter for protease/lipase
MLAVGFFTERKTSPPLIEAQKLSTEAQRYASTTLKNAQVIEAMGMMGHIRNRWLALQRKFLQESGSLSSEDIEFLEHWLTEHIYVADMQMGSYLGEVM